MPTSRRTICRDGNNKEGNARFLSHSSKINIEIPDLEETTKKLLQLELDCDYQITQINGQRKFGPPLNWTGPIPDSKCEVFVGRIPRTIFEPDLYPIFSLIGRIYEIRLMMDFSGMNRGFCFIMYTKPEDAYNAVKKLNYYEICPGHRIGVVNCINHCRLIIKQLPFYIEAEEVVKRIYDNTDEVKEVLVYRNFDEPECYALISYQTHRGAAISRKRLLPLTSCLFSNKRVIIDWANPTFYPTGVFNNFKNSRGNVDYRQDDVSSEMSADSATSSLLAALLYCICISYFSRSVDTVR
ncbi:RNA-binding protein 47-like [Polistes fuscatus]|uniref:RNA-binding protein 47-like n=1 Tax=Polistes fuscatus TaxID=30207 RepID=UPI001CAA1342|nr:RNA-binding protein 47-like [Polistes fuscatus]